MNANSHENTVLSLSAAHGLLAHLKRLCAESVIASSADSESQARFEVEMGQCGVLYSATPSTRLSMLTWPDCSVNAVGAGSLLL